MRIRTSVLAGIGAAIMLAATAGGIRGDEPATTSKPATKPAVMPDLNPALNDIYSGQRELDTILKDEGVFTDAAKREAALKKAGPVLDKMAAGAEQIKILPGMMYMVGPVKTRVEATRVALQDEAFVAKLKEQAAGTDDAAAHAKAMLARGAFIAAGKDEAALAKAVDGYAKLVGEYPQSEDIAFVTATSYFDKNTPAGLKDKIEAAITPSKTRTAQQLLGQLAADRKLNSFVDKPLTIQSFTLDGKEFSTEALKGKVVLVDFWATWCGPCVAELPRVVKIYEKYHDKGLEIVSLSFDKDVPTIEKFLANRKEITWNQVFDPKKAGWAAGKEFGINAIPTMFLIDKKGVVRTVKARGEMEELIPKLLAE